jgi:uncharacterized damage-inducible protein DinB
MKKEYETQKNLQYKRSKNNISFVIYILFSAVILLYFDSRNNLGEHMKLTELFLAELEREAAATRRTLERVPEGLYDWKPHEKSMPLGYLAELVARMPSWPVFMIKQDELDLATHKPQPLRTSRELVQALDEGVAQAREALQNTTDEHLMKHWRMLIGGRVVSDEPRYIALRFGVFNHLAHHRGQLTVYLRLNGALVPSIYGPSADEKTFD